MTTSKRLDTCSSRLALTSSISRFDFAPNVEFITNAHACRCHHRSTAQNERHRTGFRSSFRERRSRTTGKRSSDSRLGRLVVSVGNCAVECARSCKLVIDCTTTCLSCTSLNTRFGVDRWRCKPRLDRCAGTQLDRDCPELQWGSRGVLHSVLGLRRRKKVPAALPAIVSRGHGLGLAHLVLDCLNRRNSSHRCSDHWKSHRRNPPGPCRIRVRRTPPTIPPLFEKMARRSSRWTRGP